MLLMSAKNYIFTINNPTDADRSKLTDMSYDSYRSDAGVDYIVYQLETGEQGTPHYQGYVSFKNRKTRNQVSGYFPRAHIEVAKGTPLQNKEYCTKPDGRLEGPFEYGTMPGGQGKRNDIEEFVTYVRESKPGLTHRDLILSHPSIVAKYPRFARTVVSNFAKTSTTPLVPRPGWQSELVDTLSTQPDSRTVRWYYDPVGNSGKSYFCKHYHVGNPSYCITGGKFSDIYYGYAGERVVFFDWARDVQDSFPYVVIENFKNGYFLNTKYEAFPNYFDPPHVVVFANFEPDRSKLSEDRWIIKCI